MTETDFRQYTLSSANNEFFSKRFIFSLSLWIFFWITNRTMPKNKQTEKWQKSDGIVSQFLRWPSLFSPGESFVFIRQMLQRMARINMDWSELKLEKVGPIFTSFNDTKKFRK